jgi:hypothetical protein
VYRFEKPATIRETPKIRGGLPKKIPAKWFFHYISSRYKARKSIRINFRGIPNKKIGLSPIEDEANSVYI